MVKEKEEAKKEFKKAKKEGRQTVLGSVDKHRQDIMNLNIGNVPPKT